MEVNLYSFLLLVSLAHCGEKQLSLFPLKTKLLDEGWIDHGNVRARVDQTLSRRLSSIIADYPEWYNLKEISEDSATVEVGMCSRGAPWTLGKGVVMAGMSVISVLFV